MRLLPYLLLALWAYFGRPLIVHYLSIGLSPISAYWISYLPLYIALAVGIRELFVKNKKWLPLVGMCIVGATAGIKHPVYLNDFYAYEGVRIEADEQLIQSFAAVIPDENYTGIVGVYSTTCKYCKDYLAWINNTSNLEMDYIQVIGGSDSTMAILKDEIDLVYPVVNTMDNDLFSQLSMGSVPKFYYVEKGVPMFGYTSRSFNFNSIQQMRNGEIPNPQ